MGYLTRIKHSLNWRYARWEKSIEQIKAGQTRNARALFIFGVQRSGTNMLLKALDRSLLTWVYNEDNRQAFNYYRIKTQNKRQKLVEQARANWVIFKPNLDLQHADQLLNEHHGSKAIWIYRNYQDVANSAIDLWDRAQYEHIRRLVTQPESTHWFCEDVHQTVRELIDSLYYENMTDEEAGALKWYVRNRFFFELGLQLRNDQVLLLNYEELVTHPHIVFDEVTKFLSIPNSEVLYDFIFKSSINKVKFPEIGNEIQATCDNLLEKLNDALLVQRNNN